MNLGYRPIGPSGYVEDLRCHMCGQPATWRDRVVTSCCVLGQPVCDRCEPRSTSLKMADFGIRAGLTQPASALWHKIRQIRSRTPPADTLSAGKA